MSREQPSVAGCVSPGFEEVQNRFVANLRDDPTYSAQLAIYHGPDQVVDLAGGPHLTLHSVTGLFSASKGVAAIAFATLIDDGSIDLDRPVSAYWPEFAEAGKGSILVRQLLSHTAGLVGVDGGFSDDEILDSTAGAARLAKEFPIWLPGTAVGYHGLSIGVFLEELARRITGGSLQELYESKVRAPRAIDVYLGLPDAEEKRFVPVGPVVLTSAQEAQLEQRRHSPDGIAALAYNNVNNPLPLEQIYLSPNTQAVRSQGVSALGAIGSARGIARVYAASIGHIGDPLVRPETIAAMSQQQVWGRDRITGELASFAVVFQTPNPEFEFGSYRGFGHCGASGSLGMADPLYDMALGYVPNPMQYPGGPDQRAVELSALARKAITRRTTAHQ